MDGLTFNLLNQSKTLWTALCVYLLIGKRQSFGQCIALLGLLASAILLTYNPAQTEASDPDVWASSSYFIYGTVPCLIASFLSGMASALSQKALQVSG